MELQANLSIFEANGVAVFAVSYDSVATLAAFAEAHSITYPLLSDEGSVFIDRLGIRNTTIDPTGRAWGVPHPGTYFIGTDGRVTDKIFHETHRTRDAAPTMLYEHLGIAAPATGTADRQTTDTLTAVAAFDAESFVRGERVGLRVTIAMPPGIHIYGRPLPEGYIPTTFAITATEGITAEPVRYPAPRPLRMDWTDEELMIYEDEIVLTTAVTFTDQQDDVTISAILDYQACTTDECFVPQTLRFTLPMRFHPFPQ